MVVVVAADDGCSFLFINFVLLFVSSTCSFSNPSPSLHPPQSNKKHAAFTDFTRLLAEAPGLQSPGRPDVSGAWFSSKDPTAPGLDFDDFVRALHEAAASLFPDEGECVERLRYAWRARERDRDD